MPDTPSLPRVQITNPDEFTQIVPYLIGFTPEESLVIVVVTDGAVAVTARVDIADIEAAGQVEFLLDRMWARFPVADAHLIAYTTDQRAGWALLQRCVDHLPAEAVRQTLVVDGDTWRLPGGESGQTNRYGRVAADASFLGLQRLPSRSELVASLSSAPDTDDLAARMEVAFDQLPRSDETAAVITRMGELVRHNLPASADQAPATIDVGDAAQLAVLAQHGKAREAALLSITREDAREHLALWRAVVNSVPDYAAEAPLFLTGMAAWVAGEGALAAITLERSEQVGELGLYRPARLLSELIDQVVPPPTWDELRADGLAHADPCVRQAVACVHPAKVWESVPQHPLEHTRRPQPPDVAPPAPGIAI